MTRDEFIEKHGNPAHSPGDFYDMVRDVMGEVIILGAITEEEAEEVMRTRVGNNDVVTLKSGKTFRIYGGTG